MSEIVDGAWREPSDIPDGPTFTARGRTSQGRELVGHGSTREAAIGEALAQVIPRHVLNSERAWAMMSDEQRLALEESMQPAESLSQALARAQRKRDDQVRDHARHYLAHGGQLRQRRTLLGKSDGSKACARCTEAPRYPDYRCATHTAFLPEDPLTARRIDNDEAAWLTCWSTFFDRVASILRT